MTSDLAFVVAPLSRGGGEAENSWTRYYPTQGLPVSTTSVCLRFSVFLQSRPTIHCVRPSIVLSTCARFYLGDSQSLNDLLSAKGKRERERRARESVHRRRLCDQESARLQKPPRKGRPARRRVRDRATWD